MQPYVRVSFLVAAVLLPTACSDGDARLSATGPSALGTSSMTLTATAATIAVEQDTDRVCTEVTPSTVSFGVIVTPHGTSDVTVVRIRAQFTDTTGSQTPQVIVPMLPVTLTAPGPTAVFGVPTAALARTFPMTLELGCGIGTRGAIVVIVEGSDGRGRRMSEQLTIPVR